VTLQREVLPLSDHVSNRNLAAYAASLLASAGQVRQDELSRHELHLPGLDLTLWAASGAFVKLCRRLLIERASPRPAAARAEIFALDTTLEGWQQPLRWDERGGYSSREFEQRLAAAGLRGFYEHEGPSWQIFRPDLRQGVQSLASPLGLPAWERGTPLRLFLHWAHAATGRRLTHAAALGVAGRGALIVGPSGAGKSGTAIAGLAHGLDCAGDDYVLLDAGERITASTVFRMVKQDRPGLRRVGIGHPAVDRATPNWHGKIEFDPAEIGLAPLVTAIEIEAIFIPTIAHEARTSIERVSQRHAALALAPSATLQLPGDSNEGFTFFTSIAKRLPAFRLKLSESASEIAATLGEFLATRQHHAR
jgi:hypothetical protein